jgi:signal transduction histidine kinase
MSRRTRLEERVRFETLLSGLSTGLICVAAADVDTVVEAGLGDVAAFLGVDRGSFDDYGDAPGVRIRWTGPGVDALPALVNDGHFPWTAARLRAGDVVRFRRLDDLPDAAAIDRASYERLGTVAHLSVPFRTEGRLVSVLSFDSVHDGHVWPSAVAERLPLLGEAFISALERGRMDEMLRARGRFETLLSSVSETFRNLSASAFDGEVPRALQRLVDFLEIEHGALLAFSPRGSPARVWGVHGAIEETAVPGLTARLRPGYVVASRLETPCERPDVDRHSFLWLDIAAQVALPLFVDGSVVGGLVLGTADAECARRPAELIQQLQLFAEVFASALGDRQADLEMQRLRQELAHIGRVSAMGELTASLAHELNQSLTAILTNAQAAQRLLAAEVVNVAELREIVSDIATDDKRAAELIRRTRRLVGKGDLEYAWLDVNDAVAEIVRLATGDATMRHVAIRLDLAAELPPVYGDRLQIQQVVLNLVLNAIDSMQGPCVADRRLVITTTGQAAAVAVSVRDSGTGIDAEDPDDVFRPFYSTKPDGLGMGLAIARTIVIAHGGHLDASNNPDGGATFHFTLPHRSADRR